MDEAAHPEFEKLLRDMFAAFSAKDIETALKPLRSDVDWPIELGKVRIHGRDAVREYWNDVWLGMNADLEPIRFTMETDKRVVVESRQRIYDDTGRVLVDHLVRFIFTFRDGLISRMDFGAI